MQPLLIRIKRGRDGPSVLTCIRHDGTRTWSHLHPFFPTHDLMHFSVESTLGFTSAFFGLIASGWSIPDFAARGAVQRLGPEAGWAEMIVGLFDQERASGNRWTADEFNEGMRLKTAAAPAERFRAITEGELGRIRARHGDLISRWKATPPGHTMDITFSPEPLATGRT